MSFQQCRFNFGAEEFKYPPNRKFSVFNDFGVLKPQDKVVDIDVQFIGLPTIFLVDCSAPSLVSRRAAKAERD